MILNLVSENLSTSQKKVLRRYKHSVIGWYLRTDLTKLALFFKSDKWGKHYYTPIYQQHFKNYRKKKIKLLEIGVGGNKSKTHGGASLRMWKHYFRKGEIFGLDIYDKSPLEEKRIKIFQGNQADNRFLNDLGTNKGPFDIIIDDGSHINDHIIASFLTLFPYLKKGGIYVVEDLQTSYWEFFGGSSKDLEKSGTAMNFFKSLADGINYSEFIIENYKPTYLDKNVISIHFYHNMVFVYKSENKESSSFLINNKIPNNG